MGVWSRLAAVSGRKICSKSMMPIVSFTFDDAPLSAFDVGGQILEASGYRATYYVSSGLMDQTTGVGRLAGLETVMEFHGRGHEIGNHTYDHLDCQKNGLLGIFRSVRRNRKSLAGVMTGSFAYPYGSRAARSRLAAALCTTSARGISFGINRDVIDVTDLKAVRVYSRHGIDACLNLVAECATRGGWLIFYTHDVSAEPSPYGCTPEQLKRLVRSVYEQKLTVQRVDMALKTVFEQERRSRIA